MRYKMFDFKFCPTYLATTVQPKQNFGGCAEEMIAGGAAFSAREMARKPKTVERESWRERHERVPHAFANGTYIT